MPKITKLEHQKKRRGRYSVSVDGKYSFSLSDNDLLATGIYLGQEMSFDDLSQLKNVAGTSKVIDKVYNFLSFRIRTESEIRSYLKRQDCDTYEADQIVDRLKNQNLVSDEQFAQSWVGSRKSAKPTSRRKLEYELRQKGVEASVIAEAIENVSDEDEVEAIISIAKKKLTQMKYQDQLKLISYLLSKGFSYSLVKRALNDLGATGSE